MAYLYRHIRLDKNEPFYIGVGGLDEFDEYKRAQKSLQRNTIWTRISKKTKYEVEIVLDNIGKSEALEKEKEFINLYGRIDKKTGILANLTDGGEGTTGTLYDRSHKMINVKPGDIFGRLTIIQELTPIISKLNQKIRIFKCLCQCGNHTTTRIGALRNGSSKSCGCYQKELVGKIARKHGKSWKDSKSKEYECWANIKTRCRENGKICKEWLGIKGFETFLKDMGEKPSNDYRISKIKRFGIYEPSNCIWKKN